MIAIGIALATVAAFIITSIYYTVTPPTPSRQNADSGLRWWQVLLELVRTALVAGLVAGIMTAAGWHGLVAGLLVGLALTILPIVLLAGSVQWERVPVRTAVTHTGDWIIKLAVIGLIVGIFA